MRLSYDLFQQIVSGLRADTRADRDLRGEPRVGISCEAGVVASRPSAGSAANGSVKTSRIQIRDLSCTGVGLTVSNKIAKGQRFIIELPSEAGPCWLLCTAMYCQQLENKVYRVGASHTRVLQSEEVKKLAEQMLQTPSAAERDEIDRIRVAILT